MTHLQTDRPNWFPSTIGGARNLGLGLAALAVATLALPGSAAAKAGPGDISDRLDKIEYQVWRIPQNGKPRKLDRRIDKLQNQLNKLERITDRQHGRRARINARRIDRLQYRLNRMEYRIEARHDHNNNWYRGRSGAWSHDHGHGDRGYRSFPWRR